MDLQYWHKKWETKDILFHQSQIHPALRSYSHHLAQGPVFVPLCGKSLDMLWLNEAGHSVMGVEISPIACRDFFSENQKSVSIHTKNDFTIFQGETTSLWCGDFFNLPPESFKRIKGVYDRAALVALPAPVRKQYTQFLLSQLPKPFTYLLVTFEYPDEKISGPPFSVKEEEVRSLFQGFTVSLLERKLGTDLGRNPRFKGINPISECCYLITGE